MSQETRVDEQLLLDVSDGDERRTVTAIEGPSLTVMEVTSGPLTVVTYGTPRRGHKIMCAYEACTRVLGAESGGALAALKDFFCASGDEPMLSDLMDRFDVAGEHYTYVAWGADGNGVYRPSGE